MTVGTPTIAGAKVQAEIVKHFRAKKVVSFRKLKRKGFHKKIGHRQYFTELKITGISA